MSTTVLAAALRTAARTQRAGSLTVRALAAALEANTRQHITQTDLRALLGCTEMQASRAVSIAVRAGLIRREHRSEGDRRRVFLTGTSDGRHLVALLERSATTP